MSNSLSAGNPTHLLVESTELDLPWAACARQNVAVLAVAAEQKLGAARKKRATPVSSLSKCQARSGVAVAQEFARRRTRASTLAEGLDPIDDDRAIALRALHSPPFAAG